VSLWRPIWSSFIIRLGDAPSSSSCGRARKRNQENYVYELQRPRDEDKDAVSYRRGRDMTMPWTTSQQRKSVTD
jgi:hypothetical protein